MVVRFDTACSLFDCNLKKDCNNNKRFVILVFYPERMVLASKEKLGIYPEITMLLCFYSNTILCSKSSHYSLLLKSKL